MSRAAVARLLRCLMPCPSAFFPPAGPVVSPELDAPPGVGCKHVRGHDTSRGTAVRSHSRSVLCARMRGADAGSLSSPQHRAWRFLGRRCRAPSEARWCPLSSSRRDDMRLRAAGSSNSAPTDLTLHVGASSAYVSHHRSLLSLKRMRSSCSTAASRLDACRCGPVLSNTLDGV
jgi:hypothetical protein